MLGKDDASKGVWDRLSKYITPKGMDSSWEGDILDSIFELGSETYEGAKREHTRKLTAGDLPTSLSPDAGSLISLHSEAV